MTMDRNSPPDTPLRDPRNFIVLSIDCLKGSSKADEWTGDMLQTGDIVEEFRIGAGSSSGSGSYHQSCKAPFKNGKSGVQKILHSAFKNKETSILVRIRRGMDEFAELHACIVPESGSRKQYILRSISDPNYTVGFIDRSEADCFELQASRSSRIVSALSRATLQDGYVAYPWAKRMQEVLSVPNSSCFLSLLLLPRVSDRVASRYNDLEDTLARANAWLYSAQASGVPITFMNIQTESLLTKISGETASSTVNAGSLSDLSNLSNVSLYGFEDYHGVDIGVVRAVRLWYAPVRGEYAIEMKIREGDSKLGFAIGRTEEGFIYVSSVNDDDESTPSLRSGLNDLYKEARSISKLLVVSRVANQKVLPWMVSSTGAIRCYDTVSLSQKLSLHRHAKMPIFVHVFLWDQAPSSVTLSNARHRSISHPVMPMPTEVQVAREANENHVLPLPAEIPWARHPNERQVVPLTLDDSPNENIMDRRDEAEQRRIQRDTAGEVSFRFRDFSVSNKWV